jgi:hypothetical protein
MEREFRESLKNVVVLSFDLIVDGEMEYEVLLGLDHGHLKMA